ncbi:MAG: anhydro-N-acetylmuramic acid kinase [Alphaproteobacteria bacterium]|nr:anhydro-N-acetylmuramic acid kinase [Alphaproteobacteria bacterium]
MTTPSRRRTIIGLMSGTSMDGIDAAVLTTDGEAGLDRGPALSRPYSPALRAQLRKAMELAPQVAPGAPVPAAIAEAERAMTLAHAAAVTELRTAAEAEGLSPSLVGFHGQTIFHDPDRRRTWQIGDGALMAELTGLDVVHDFRSADVAAGGQGAPFAPLYHAALVAAARAEGKLEGAVGVLNLGGVGNVTWLGEGGGILAFDTGPANGPCDDWVEAHTGAPMDAGGAIASRGTVHEERVTAMLDHPYFDLAPPKSLDRQDFTMAPVRGLSLEDGAATLIAFSAACVAAARAHLPEAPALWIACGGGRHNPALMAALEARLGVPVRACETVGWRGDELEAEAFAYLAMRSALGLPLSVPGTTGVPEPMTGGRLVRV